MNIKSSMDFMTKCIGLKYFLIILFFRFFPAPMGNMIMLTLFALLLLFSMLKLLTLSLLSLLLLLLLLLLSLTFAMILAATLPAANTKFRKVNALGQIVETQIFLKWNYEKLEL